MTLIDRDNPPKWQQKYGPADVQRRLGPDPRAGLKNALKRAMEGTPAPPGEPEVPEAWAQQQQTDQADSPVNQSVAHQIRAGLEGQWSDHGGLANQAVTAANLLQGARIPASE